MLYYKKPILNGIGFFMESLFVILLIQIAIVYYINRMIYLTKNTKRCILTDKKYYLTNYYYICFTY